MTTRMHTQDAAQQMSEMNAVQRSLHLILQERLTPTQYRRVVLLYGLDGEPALSLRKAAEVEGRYFKSVEESKHQALRRLQRDWRLWAFWLLGAGSDPHDSYEAEGTPLHLRIPSGAAKASARDRRAILAHPDDPDSWDITEMVEAEGFTAYGLRPGRDAWESDAMNPAPTVEEAYGDGWIARNENVSESENPYYGDQKDAWQQGWNDAISAS